MDDPQNAQNAVFVSNLTWWTTDVQLEQLCTQYSGGKVIGMKFIEDKSCGKSRGMCVVDLDSPQAVQRCIDQMNGVEVDGRNVRVSRQQNKYGAGGPGGPGGSMGRGGGMAFQPGPPPMGGGIGGMNGMGGMGGNGWDGWHGRCADAPTAPVGLILNSR